MAVPESSGTEPPTRPVLPPCGTIGTRCSAHSATTRATSSVLLGRTTQMPLPLNSSR